MNDMSLSEAVTFLQNQGRLLKAVISIAEQIDSVEKLNQLTEETNARLAKAVDREAELKDIDARIAAGNAELAELEPRLAKMRETARQILGDAA